MIKTQETFLIIRNIIEGYEKVIKNDHNIFKGNLLGFCELKLLKADTNAFLFGLISDQSVKAEIAWSLPYRLKQRLGTLDIDTISRMGVEKIADVIKKKPALHRYPTNIAKYLTAASEKLILEYEGNASNIWKSDVSAEEIGKRLEEFKGISKKKAALGCLLLVRDFGVVVKDKENINLAFDLHIRRICLRTGMSRIDSVESIEKVGKSIFPDFPGRLTSSLWAIGRDVCRPTEPACHLCPLHKVCDYCCANKGV